MAENLLRDRWADLDQADLWLLLDERIGGPGQYDGNPDVLHLPEAREKCRVSLTYEDSNIVAIEPGAAFDRPEWNRICQEIETSVLNGPQKLGETSASALFPWMAGGVARGRECKSFRHRKLRLAPANLRTILLFLNFQSKKRAAYGPSPMIAADASIGG
jgi:hypothetical protein